MNLQGLTAFITGAASGLGAATARHLAAKGCRVVLVDRDEAKLSELAAALDALACVADVTHEAAIVHAIEEATRWSQTPRVWVNCAGVAPARRMVSKSGIMPLEDFERVIQINLLGSFNVMRLAAAAMMALEPLETAERGVIIHTASVAAYEGQIGQTAYSASKGGIVGMTLPAARELASFGIRVMTIAPGIMATPMLQAMPQEVQDSLAVSVPFPKRLGHPEEYAHLVEHIAENVMLNGSVIRLDGAIRLEPK